ncbi:hypothetical protein ACQP2T_18790 [Nonomuraea sp. CA-143628]|uniref:hypothetical protein n=1 Tax=Nonomuraea sp. CA-143628 TaxID=3239997 RepID=UPI003D8D51B0
MSVLEINDLHAEFRLDAGTIKPVNGVSLSVEEGQTPVVVGESGSARPLRRIRRRGAPAARSPARSARTTGRRWPPRAPLDRSSDQLLHGEAAADRG